MGLLYVGVQVWVSASVFLGWMLFDYADIHAYACVLAFQHDWDVNMGGSFSRWGVHTLLCWQAIPACRGLCTGLFTCGP